MNTIYILKFILLFMQPRYLKNVTYPCFNLHVFASFDPLTIKLSLALWENSCWFYVADNQLANQQVSTLTGKNMPANRMLFVRLITRIAGWCEAQLFTVSSSSLRYCDDSHLWYEKHTSEVCRRVRRVSFSRSKWIVEEGAMDRWQRVLITCQAPLILQQSFLETSQINELQVRYYTFTLYVCYCR